MCAAGVGPHEEVAGEITSGKFTKGKWARARGALMRGLSGAVGVRRAHKAGNGANVRGHGKAA